MKDGGHVCLDWYNVVDREQPTILFLPGITGKVSTSHPLIAFKH